MRIPHFLIDFPQEKSNDEEAPRANKRARLDAGRVEDSTSPPQSTIGIAEEVEQDANMPHTQDLDMTDTQLDLSAPNIQQDNREASQTQLDDNDQPFNFGAPSLLQEESQTAGEED